MILVDTSIWIDHLRHTEPELVQALTNGQVMTHPFVIGELACGNLNNRAALLRDLRTLPQAAVVTEREALAFIDGRRLMGRGIGYIDVHLLASVVLAGGAVLWTRDRRLAAIAQELGVACGEPA